MPPSPIDAISIGSGVSADASEANRGQSRPIEAGKSPQGRCVASAETGIISPYSIVRFRVTGADFNPGKAF